MVLWFCILCRQVPTSSYSNQYIHMYSHCLRLAFLNLAYHWTRWYAAWPVAVQPALITCFYCLTLQSTVLRSAQFYLYNFYTMNWMVFRQNTCSRCVVVTLPRVTKSVIANQPRVFIPSTVLITNTSIRFNCFVTGKFIHSVVHTSKYFTLSVWQREPSGCCLYHLDNCH